MGNYVTWNFSQTCRVCRWIKRDWINKQALPSSLKPTSPVNMTFGLSLYLWNEGPVWILSFSSALRLCDDYFIYGSVLDFKFCFREQRLFALRMTATGPTVLLPVSCWTSQRCPLKWTEAGWPTRQACDLVVTMWIGWSQWSALQV